MASKADQFRKGNIYRIYFKNFLTYDEIEIFPKPHLNVVIGPNGTGKSSILCGICIGLGGKPEVTGRGKHITEYIKHGKDSAVIEIELYNDGNNYIVKRVFFRQEGKKNIWYFQGAEVREKVVIENISKLNIQVNNLCQFLPQDRVVEFAKMNNVQLLSSTEKAVGEMKLFEQHEILSQNGRVLQDMNKRLADMRNQLNNEIKKNEQLKEQVRNIKLKEDLDKSIEELKILVMFCKYNSLRKEFYDTQAPIQKIEEECKGLDAKIKPNKDKLAQMDKTIHSQKISLEKYNRESNMFVREIDKLKTQWEQSEEEIVIAHEEFRNLEQSARLKDREISDLKKQLQVLINQMSEVQNVEESILSQELRKLTELISSESQKLLNIQTSYGDLKMELKGLNEHIKLYQTRLSAIQDTRKQRLEILRHRNKHAYETVQWLQNNRHMFGAPVYDPMFTEINFTDPSNAKYLENTVSKLDLVAFVCEDKHDVTLLKREADSHGWFINILHSSPVDPAKYKPSLPIERLTHLGFEAYLKDVVSAPHAILSYLCRNYNIHNIPFAEKADSDLVPPPIQLFFIGNQRYSKRQSLYDGLWSTNVSDIISPFYLALSSNPDEERKIQRKLNELGENWKSLSDNRRKLEDEEKQVEHELRINREQKQKLMMQKDQRRQLQARINQKQEQITRREQTVIDLTKAESNKQMKIKRNIGRLKEICLKYSEIEKKITNNVLQSQMDALVDCCLQQKKRALKRSMEEDSILIANKKTEKQELEKKRRECGKAAKDLYSNIIKDIRLAKNNSQDIPEGVTEIPSRIRHYYMSKINNRTLDSLKDALAAKEADRNCIITCDDSVLMEYNRREEKITSLKGEEEKIMFSLEAESRSVEACRREWLPKINELTSKINFHFSEFMSRLNCAGEVLLDKGSDENDFSQYGLIIRVKFRDSEKLKELTAHQQSGGERSVSTALYLMALQTLATVPFRCVDEINQGMDPTNERKMFTMLVQTTTTETASQYFLITPKLLPNLPFNEYVNFMNIMNWYSTSSISRTLSTAKILNYHKKFAKKHKLNHL